MKKVAAFIDASNLWEAQKIRGKMFDYEKLRKHLKESNEADDLKIFYYTAYPSDGTRDYDLSGRHNFYVYLKKGLGFTVRKKELKRIKITSEEGDSIQEKGNMDVEMTIDALHHMKNYDEAIIFSGDSDFLSLIKYLRNGGKKVFVYSSKNNVSEELRTGADGYTDVLTIGDDIWGRDLKYRESKK